jgi:hypothetical protein
MRRIAAVISGPMPSPGMRVIVCFAMVVFLHASGAGGSPCTPHPGRLTVSARAR